MKEDFVPITWKFTNLLDYPDGSTGLVFTPDSPEHMWDVSFERYWQSVDRITDFIHKETGWPVYRSGKWER